MFLQDGKADVGLSRTGALAIGVPGALAAYDLAIREHGNIDLSDHLGQAAAIAEKGFALDKAYLRRLGGGGEETAAISGQRPASSRPRRQRLAKRTQFETAGPRAFVASQPRGTPPTGFTVARSR